MTKRIVFWVWVAFMALTMVFVKNTAFAGKQAKEYTTFREVRAPYIEMYGRPNLTDSQRFKDPALGRAYYRMYQWDNVGVQVIFIRVRKIRGGGLKSSNGWIVYGVFGRCTGCGNYHIPLPIA